MCLSPSVTTLIFSNHSYVTVMSFPIYVLFIQLIRDLILPPCRIARLHRQAEDMHKPPDGTDRKMATPRH
jgi:hypothetical protein